MLKAGEGKTFLCLFCFIYTSTQLNSVKRLAVSNNRRIFVEQLKSKENEND